MYNYMYVYIAVANILHRYHSFIPGVYKSIYAGMHVCMPSKTGARLAIESWCYITCCLWLIKMSYFYSSSYCCTLTT